MLISQQKMLSCPVYFFVEINAVLSVRCGCGRQNLQVVTNVAHVDSAEGRLVEVNHTSGTRQS